MQNAHIVTRAGSIEGVRGDRVISWLGIPYAEAERFAAPAAVKPWQGILAADAFAPQCPQLFFGTPARRAKYKPPRFEENCLFLNIWTPAGKTSDLKPVFVWIHGGAFLAGSSNGYVGDELARSGDMVVVTFNYRLGVLGFVNFAEALDLPAMPSNLGLRDQIAALEWVRDNIETFGGDPGRVTIAGESAGSLSISLLMLSPVAWPLFHGAILQSGAINLIHDRNNSLRIAQRYVALLDIGQGDMNTLRSIGLPQFFAAQATIDAQEHNGLPASPWFDGDLLPESLEAARAAATAPVPLLAGFNREEIRLFEVLPGDILPTRWPDLERLVRIHLPAQQADRIFTAYPRTRRGRRALATDLTFAMPTRNFAERHCATQPTWVYRFDYRHPLLGACHALGLAFLWPFRGLLGVIIRGGFAWGARARLADRIKRHWAHFVTQGRPHEDWPPYTPDVQTVRLFGLLDRTVDDPDAARHAAWSGRDIPPTDG